MTVIITDATIAAEVEAKAKSAKWLKRQLQNARNVLGPHFRKTFSTWTFDREGRRLLSGCGRYALVWRVRNRPDQPSSYHNQQTSVGIVVLIEI